MEKKRRRGKDKYIFSSSGNIEKSIMKILIISQYYYPEQFLINDIAPELVKRGNNVTVIAGVPNYPTGKIYDGYEHGKRREEFIKGVHVIRCNNSPRGNNKIQLLWNYMTFMFIANTEAKKLDSKYDVVFLYQLTPIFQAYAAVKYSKRNRVNLICYCLDLAPASGEKLIGNSGLLFSLYRLFSKWVYSNCSYIAVTSKSFINYLHNVHSIPMDRICYLPQHASKELLKIDTKRKKTDNVTKFMFAGNIGTGAALETIVYAVEKIANIGSNFKVFLVGNGSDKDRLQKMVIDKGLSKWIIFHDMVPIEKMTSIYQKIDALLVTLRIGQTTLPAKVQAYMATGKPIFGAMDGSGYDIIKEANCGKCTSAENAHELSAIMKDYIIHPDKYQKCGKNGRAFFKANFTLEYFIDKLLHLLH